MRSFLIKKDGFTKSKNQRFKCKDCSKKFTFVKRCKAQDLYTSYLRDKKSLSILANDDKISISTIQRSLKSIKIAEPVKLNHIKEVMNASKICQKQIMVCEREFAHLKTKLRVHSGLKFTNKMKFISNYFALKNHER